MLTSLILSMPLSDGDGVKQTTVAFRTLGCKLNQCETAQMQEILTESGYTLVNWDGPADIRVINTCTVTAKSDRSCRREIRLAKRIDPDCLVAVTGCYAQVDPEGVAAIPGVDLVLGNIEKLAVAQHLANAGFMDGSRTDTLPTMVSEYPDSPTFDQEFISHFYGYTRAFLKIQNGCDSRCAYCIIPVARGPARSMPRDRVLEQVRLLRQRGFREIVLTGINLGSWGRDTGDGSLAPLLKALTSDVLPDDQPFRLRLSSIEPMEIDQDLLDAVEQAGEGIAHHFHLPLQSGSSTVLRRMNRPYQPTDYYRVVSEIAERFPDAALGADVIVGFPGETETEFKETVTFIEESPLTYLHVFSYSDRTGTAASAMPAKINPDIVHARSLHLRELGERKGAEFFNRMRGREQRALILKERGADGRLVGLTGNYLEIVLTGDDSLMNRFVRATLGAQNDEARWEVAGFSAEVDT